MLGKEEKPSYLYVKQVKVRADMQLHRIGCDCTEAAVISLPSLIIH